MGWFMPSYGRPQKMLSLLAAPGGWPDNVVVQINADDPTLPEYRRTIDLSQRWHLQIVPAGARCSDVHRLTYEWHPDEDWYGFLMDDLWPITPHWAEQLIRAAGSWFFAIPQGPGYPKSIRSAFVMGGDLVRAMGAVVPAPLRHWCEDCIWDDIAGTLGLMRPVNKAIVDHRNFEFGTADNDATYVRNREFIEHDRATFDQWMKSTGRTALLNRVRVMMAKEAA